MVVFNVDNNNIPDTLYFISATKLSTNRDTSTPYNIIFNKQAK